jgi:hypothetical protein
MSLPSLVYTSCTYNVALGANDCCGYLVSSHTTGETFVVTYKSLERLNGHASVLGPVESPSTLQQVAMRELSNVAKRSYQNLYTAHANYHPHPHNESSSSLSYAKALMASMGVKMASADFMNHENVQKALKKINKVQESSVYGFYT